MHIPDTSAGARLRWLVEHTGEGSASPEEIADQFEPGFLQQVGLDPIVGFLTQSAFLRSAEIVEADERGNSVVVKFLIEGTNVLVQLAVSADVPHRITGLSVSSGPTRVEALDATPGSDAPVEQILDEHLAPFAADLNAGGIAAGVLRDGVRTIRSFGDAPVDGVYDVGSITKPFIGILLAEMAQRGIVTLSDLASAYLPDGLFSHPVTLEHLATHTSGLPRLPMDFRPTDMSDPYATFTTDVMYESLRGTTLESEPGTRSEYSNLGYFVLGHVLAVAGGRPAEELLAEFVCEPLGLSNTKASPTQPPGAVQGYARSLPTPWWTCAVPGPGGVSSTVDDLLSFVAANIDPDATRLASALKEAQATRFDAGDRMRVGLGWHTIEREDGTSVVWHNGGTGGFRCFLGLHPPTKTAVVGLCNNGDSDPDVPVISVLGALLNA